MGLTAVLGNHREVLVTRADKFALAGVFPVGKLDSYLLLPTTNANRACAQTPHSLRLDVQIYGTPCDAPRETAYPFRTRGWQLAEE